jgi:hypothetical protein
MVILCKDVFTNLQEVSFLQKGLGIIKKGIVLIFISVCIYIYFFFFLIEMFTKQDA